MKGDVMNAKWLTLVFRATTPEELENARRILRETEKHWAVASWSNAIQDRDDLQDQLAAARAKDAA